MLLQHDGVFPAPAAAAVRLDSSCFIEMELQMLEAQQPLAPQAAPPGSCDPLWRRVDEAEELLLQGTAAAAAPAPQDTQASAPAEADGTPPPPPPPAAAAAAAAKAEVAASTTSTTPGVCLYPLNGSFPSIGSSPSSAHPTCSSSSSSSSGSSSSSSSSGRVGEKGCSTEEASPEARKASPCQAYTITRDPQPLDGRIQPVLNISSSSSSSSNSGSSSSSSRQRRQRGRD
ncbi:hypothetical protein ACSSS7_000194 [Eimeria intestinalis]